MTDAPAHDTDAAVGRSALRKASWRLLPLLGLGYGVAYMDRANISFASLQMNQDLHFSNAIYGLGAGLFFISYAALELPSNLALVRFGARRWIARIMITWGVLAVAMMFVHSPMQFYVMRFLLGAAEAGFFPGVIYYLTQWFPSEVRASAVSRFYIAYPLSSVLMGAVAGWLLGLRGQLGLAGWQWLFLVEGAPAILLSLVFLTQLPDGPADAKWLTTEERDWISRRLALDAATRGIADHNLLTTFRQPVVWVLGLSSLCIQFVAYAVNLNAPAILKAATHFSVGWVGGLVSLISLAGAGTMIVAAWRSDRTGERVLYIFILQTLSATALLAVGLIGGGRATVIGYAVVVTTGSAVQSVIWAIPGDLLRGRSAAAAVAAIGAISMGGGFLGPTLFGIVREHTGDFNLGIGLLSIPALAAAVIMLGLRKRAAASTAA
jgi:ACS family tartrate transporter-like MFS transporter